MKFIIFFIILLSSNIFSNEINRIINEKFLDRKLESIEGIWKSIRGSSNWNSKIGCITTFYKVSLNKFNQENIINCSHNNQLTGAHNKSTDNYYYGENRITGTNRDVKWLPTSWQLSNDYSFVELTLKYGRDEYKTLYQRVWPENLMAHNNAVVNKKQEKQKNYNDNTIIAVASGSGFVVSESGFIITNNHVINGCNEVTINYNSNSYDASVVQTDNVNDLALLKADFNPDTILPISETNADLLEEIYVAGFPFGESISKTVKVTMGIVSSLSGIGNNFSNLQIDAALQPGNSGGPILNNKGNVVGVAVSKLDFKTVLDRFGVVPEGTNFGIKSSSLTNFLQSNNVKTIPASNKNISRSELAKKITSSTIFVSCYMTYANIEKFKSQKVMFKDLQ